MSEAHGKNAGENSEGTDKGNISALENNRRIFATYSREKLIQFLCDCSVGSIAGKRPEEIKDDEVLRSFALAITQGG